MKEQDWFLFDNAEQIDTPALLIYPDRVQENINRLKGMVKSVDLLRPHIKTSKSAEVAKLMLQNGITKFKCATIAEAEMLGICKAPDVLLAYQPTLPKFKRLLQLIEKYPDTKYSCLVDNEGSVSMIAKAWQQNLKIPVYIDLNVGMDRTGIKPEKAFDLYNAVQKYPEVKFMGFHAYDGHIRDIDIHERINHCEHDYKPVDDLRNRIKDSGHPFPLLVAGGSPTSIIHSKKANTESSPGTFIFWDKGYHDTIPEQPFLFAAIVLTTVVSFPDDNKMCVDLGYKSISSENDLQHRVYFLNAPGLKPCGHSEEHMVIEVPEKHQFKIGDKLYALPLHICPSVAMYNNAYVIKDHKLVDKWEITARGREVTI